jgi:hypothetical protein
MAFAIHKSPAKVLLLGLAVFALYFSIAVAFFANTRYYYLVLITGTLALGVLVVRSVASAFVGALTVTEGSIQMVTWVGGITEISFDELDAKRLRFDVTGLLLVPRNGESIYVSVFEYSRADIMRLAKHIVASLEQRATTFTSADGRPL